MDQMAGSESGSASCTDMIKHASRLSTKKLTKEKTIRALHKFVQDKWLNEVSVLRNIGFLSILNISHTTLKIS